MRVVPLSQVRDGTFGGKALGLARLLEAGARVPEGLAMEPTLLAPEDWEPSEREAWERGVERLLSGGPVAVRSSALCEDGARQSFAGQFESVLGVADLAGARAAAARCVASGATDRVRALVGHPDPVPVGVVVQRQVPAWAAGVVFTRDPAGKDGALLVEAVEGLGGALVSGHQEPHRWRVYRDGRGEPVIRGQGILSHAQVGALAREAEGLARALGHPLDLEWAMDPSGVPFWVQARPITALSPPPPVHVQRALEGVDDGPITVWSSWNVRETLPDPLRPLSWSLWRDRVLPLAVRDLTGVAPDHPLARALVPCDLVNGRLVFNMNGALGLPVVGSVILPLLGHIDGQLAPVLQDLQRQGVFGARKLPGGPWRVLPQLFSANVEAVLRLRHGLRPRKAREDLLAVGRSFKDRPPLRDLTDAQVLEEVRCVDDPVATRLVRGIQLEVLAVGIWALADTLFRPFPQARALLACGIQHNPTTAISLGLDRLVDAARPLASAFQGTAEEILHRLPGVPGGPIWLQQLQSFLEEFGHRGPKEFDHSSPRWADDPTPLVDLVRVALASPVRGLAGRLMDLGERRRAAIQEAVTRAPAWKRPLLRLLARLVEEYMPLRETPKHAYMYVFQRGRGAAVELGRRLVERGALDRPDSVFFLELEELGALVAGAPGPGPEQVEARRREFQRLSAQKTPEVWRSDGVPVDLAAPPDTAEGVLRGTAVSRGRVEGVVRILQTPDPEAVGPGDILVVELADPGWTPLFPRVAGLVMEVGGLMCHAAVMAREIGLPAVFGVRGATTALLDGQRVEVDGEEGVVRVVPQAPGAGP